MPVWKVRQCRKTGGIKAIFDGFENGEEVFGGEARVLEKRESGGDCILCLKEPFNKHGFVEVKVRVPLTAELGEKLRSTDHTCWREGDAELKGRAIEAAAPLLRRKES